jgi:hypothetical protein
MTKENFSETNEMFRDNLNTSLKWFQDSTAGLTEARMKQTEIARSMYNRIADHLFEINRNNLELTAGISEKFLDGLKKTSENFLSATKTSLESLNNDNNSSEPQNFFRSGLADALRRQTELTEEINAGILNTLNSQISFTKSLLPVLERSKNDLRSTFEIPRDIVSDVNNYWNEVWNSWFGITREVINEMNNQANIVVKNNLKSWSETYTPKNGSQSAESNNSPLKKVAVENDRKKKEVVI